MSEHAILAPSSAHRWMTCAASLAMELGKPNRSSKFSDEGTAAHELAAMCLNAGKDTAAYAGRMIKVGETTWEVNDEMQHQVQKYLENIGAYVNGSNILYVEERVDFSRIVGFPDSFGTADAIIIDTANRELQIHDLKYGRGVEVSAKENEQLMIYALGALDIYGLLYDFDKVRLVIHQVRLRETPDEWPVSVKDLHEFSIKVHAAALKAMKFRARPEGGYIGSENFLPTEDNCRFCKASGVCPAQDKRVREIIEGELTLAEKRDRVAFVEGWCKAVCNETDAALRSQKKVPGWILAEGRKGDRKYRDEDKAARIMAAALTPDELYTKKLVSPAQAEKLLKKPSPETWARLNTIIYQEDGKPSVVRDSEGRTEITVKPKADVFDNLDEGAGPWTR